MPSRDDDRFRLKPAPPKSRTGPRTQRFLSQVLKQISKSGANASGARGVRSTSNFGRGRVAAGMAGRELAANARRVVIKSRYVVLKKAGAKSVSTHLRYIERDGVTRDGQPAHAYGPTTDSADLKAFEDRGRGDRHQFRFIVSVEDGEQLEDLRGYTREFMQRMSIDLETRLEWVAVDHWDTDNPHTHIVLRGRAANGQDLVIAPAYMAQGMRARASELATEFLGPRTELEIRQGLLREVDQERWTSLDRRLQGQSRDDMVELTATADAQVRTQRTLLLGRLQKLTAMGLVEPNGANRWTISADMEPILRAMGERGDILRTMQRAVGVAQRELSVFTPDQERPAVIGRIIGKGLADELNDRGYLVVDGIDGRAHYVALSDAADLSQYPPGAIVETRGSTEIRAADKTIAAQASDGVYRTDHHLAAVRSQANPNRDPKEFVAAHVRRLEALRQAGIVERIAGGVWRIPTDLPERGRDYDVKRLGGSAVALQSHLPIEQQTRVIGATWLDRQLIGGDAAIADKGFGGKVREALRERTDFLAEQSLAERKGQRVILARNLLAILRDRDIAGAAKSISAETGLAHQAVGDGERVTGVYRRTVLLASGRFALLDNGMGFSLVPWRPVIEQRLGRTLTAVVRGSGATWKLGQQLGHGVG